MNSFSFASLIVVLALAGVAFVYWQTQQRTQALQNQLNDAIAGRQRLQDFLASMSHHLRTPLNGVMGYAEYVYSSTSEPMIKFTSKIILENSLQMLHLVNGLLDLTKIQEGSLELSNAEFEIQEVVESVRALHQARANDLKITLNVNMSHNAPHRMRADPYRVRQVLNNLVDNALNYNKQNGSVLLSVSPSANGQFITFSVQDTGQGVPADVQKTLFQRKQQKKEPFVLQPHEGAGLGLILSYQLVDLMGGVLDYTTQAGQGSLFFFTLPLRDAKH
jgi:two-component system, NarL family, sensor histidine kinase BarA